MLSWPILNSHCNPKPWNLNSSSRASKIWCRISHIIKKASILESSAARLATNSQNRGEDWAWEKIQHCLQNRVPRVQILLPLPSIKEPVNAYDSAFAGFFYAKIARLDTLYRCRITVAKSSKCPIIREYFNCCRLVHHQKSISKFREKDGLVPCAEDGWLAEKTNASFLFNLVVFKIDDLLDCGWCAW